MANSLTPLQAHALATLADVGICDAQELSRHMMASTQALGPVLRSLEGRGLIGRQYTGHRYAAHAYVATGDGHAAARAYFEEEDQ